MNDAGLVLTIASDSACGPLVADAVNEHSENTDAAVSASAAVLIFLLFIYFLPFFNMKKLYHKRKEHSMQNIWKICHIFLAIFCERAIRKARLLAELLT